MPVFVKIEKHHDITNSISAIKNKISTARKTLEKIKELKQQEDSEITTWQSKIDDMEKKMGFFEEAMKQE